VSILQAKPKSIARSIWPLTKSSLKLSKQFHRTCDNLTKQKPKLNMYDKANLTRIKKMNELAPEVMKAFWAFDKAAVAEGAIPVKYKELIAVAVALTTQCPYCIDIHSNNARKAGATEAELTEAAMVSAALRAGAAVTHATHALTS
jgi:alkylhydroperoxidase AhpD family core domain